MATMTSTTAAPTEQQMAYRASLRDRAIARFAGTYAKLTTTPDAKMFATAYLAMTLALPEPTNRAEISEQITALSNGEFGMHDYMVAHQEWAGPVVARVTMPLPEISESQYRDYDTGRVDRGRMVADIIAVARGDWGK